MHYEIKKGNHLLSPPTLLKSLPLNRTMNPIESLPDLSITRISYDPDMFVMRNFLSTPVEQIDMIRAAVKNGMEYSGTSSGNVVSQRFKSYTSWIYSDDDDRNNSTDPIDEEVENNGKFVARYMTELAADLFFPERLVGKDSSEVCSAEAVQGKC